ncbi:hypothetical protein EN781_00150 [Mesorhizobium sp. M4A.F.Ca.ET.090.04.2.1]|uniref:hypothetical protein n=1 Tax=Mesorhizobium sp. M4A.F.Ca.ET.090.04.2.1 TaxID=2496663 RepID=UPI000FCB9BDE|nr:hypothetical protein [Mesorhizobium sp. M4A.F.Ca.ET.090.04.2.1]RVC47583.1 hypothetical protein EN781_00150 [Mesorhizobium sp. M4A.F.Ca.ET.090.04.2.1]
MASQLEAQLAKTIAKAFKGKLLKGTLRREVPGTGNDSFGDPNSGSVATYPFEGIREDYTATFRAQAGIPSTDVRVLIIAGSIGTAPKQDDQVLIRSAWHKVRAIESIDPANATYALQCFEIRDQTA